MAVREVPQQYVDEARSYVRAYRKAQQAVNGMDEEDQATLTEGCLCAFADADLAVLEALIQSSKWMDEPAS